MRKFLKSSILEIFQTIYEAHGEIKKLVEKKDFERAHIVLGDCQEAAIEIGTAIENSEGEGIITVDFLEEYCETVYKISNDIVNGYDSDKVQKVLDKKLLKAEISVKNDIKVKLEIVFLPYKASMWDSLESVWKAAYEDSDCNVYVIPIPYYDRKPDKSLGDYHYEGGNYPNYVSITYYEDYDFEKSRPDVIYIHNPYDQANYVTSIDPRFYSNQLKKYTNCLVYIPYFVAGYYASEESARKYIMPGIVNSDLVVLQNDNQKRGYGFTKQLEKKMIVMGSPKIDKVLNNIAQIKVPDELMSKIHGRKIIMVNSSISRILNDKQWNEKMEELVNVFEDKSDLFLLWRPHPLLITTIDAMRPQNKFRMRSIIDRIENMENSYIDWSSSPDVAISISDGLISDYSSIVLQYTATGKPVLLTVGSSVFRDTKFVCCDYFSNYFINDGMSIEQFCLMLCENNDYKKEERMRYFVQSIKNCDGTSGQKIHEYVKEQKRFI